jgi:hypothetical protein
MDARITAASQQYRLREQIEKSHIRHDQTVRVDIPRVRVAAGVGGPDATIFFCDVEPLKIRRALTDGDDQPIPETVVMEGITFPDAGEYDLKDAVLHCNGTMRITGDWRTRVSPRGEGFQSRIGRLFTTQIW